MIDEKKVLEMLSEADPIGLAPGHATPEDEYSPEAKYIVETIKEESSENELAIELEGIFTKFFDEKLAKNNPEYPKNYRILAQRIKTEIEKSNGKQIK